MSLASDISRNNYLGNGAANVYNFTFKIFIAAHLTVIIRDIAGLETVLTEGVDYTVAGVNQSAGGSITLIDAGQAWIDVNGFLVQDFVIALRRVVSIVQNTDFRNQGQAYRERHEDKADYLTMIDQQQKDDLNRSIKLPQSVSFTEFDPTLPAGIIGQGGFTVVTNPAGNGFIVGPTVGQIAGAAAAAVQAIASAAAALASQLLAMDWAIKTTDTVDGSEYSAKEYAIGILRRGLAFGGSSKDWANFLGGTVDDTEYSAKKYAIDNAASVATINLLIQQLIAATNIQLTLGFQRSLGYGDNISTVFNIGGLYNGMSVVPTKNGMILRAAEYNIVGSSLNLNFVPDQLDEIGVFGFYSAQGDTFTIEPMVGTINDVNKTFTYTATAKDADSFLVFKAGQFLHKSKYSNDLTTKTIVTDDAPGLGQYMIAITLDSTTGVKCKQMSLGLGTIAGKSLFGPMLVKPFDQQSTIVMVNGVQVDQDDFTIVSDLFIQLDFTVDNVQEVEVIASYLDANNARVIEFRALTVAENGSRTLKLKAVPQAYESVIIHHQDASFLVYDIDFSIANDILTLKPTARSNAIGTGEYLLIDYKI